MFRSRKTRRRDRSKATNSRRLRVESMESRMMLSASGLDLSAYPVDQSQFTIKTISSPTASYAGLTTQADGGFIAVTNNYYSSDTAIHRGVLNADSVVDAIPWKLSGATASQGVDYSGTYSWHTDWQPNSNGLDGAVIVPNDNLSTNSGTNSDSTLSSDFKPIVIGPNPSPGNSSNPSSPPVSEGGSIPIHAIFADFRKDSQLTTGVKAVATPVVQASAESLTSPSPLSSADSALTGEWARAMVFEIAGGEPTASDLRGLGKRGDKSGSDDTLQPAEPLSSVDTSHQTHKQSGRSAAETPAVDTSANAITPAQAQQQSLRLAAVMSQLLDSGKLAAGFSAPMSAAQLSAADLLGTGKTDSHAVAAAAVFDKLGDENTAVIESSADGKSWLRSLAVSPLLMVLALERIAALKSRRATRESHLAAAKKPLRFHS